MEIDGENAQHQFTAIQEDEDGISVPNWLIDVLKWISRIEMANSSLSFSCRMFKQLCWPKLHGDVKPHIVPYLKFCHEPDEFGHLSCILKSGSRGPAIPIAATPPPDYILGFENIHFHFLDNRVVEFVKNVTARQIKVKLALPTLFLNCKKTKEQIAKIGHFLDNLTINELQFSNYYDEDSALYDLNRHFPAIIDNVPFLNVLGPKELESEIVFNWLKKQQTDGAQKILEQIFNEQQRELELKFLNRVKKNFLNATKPSLFVMLLEFEYEQFSLQNQQTGEFLTLYHERDSSDGEIYNFVARYPQGEEHWMEGSQDKVFTNNYYNYFQLEIEEWEDMENNKGNAQDCSPNLIISEKAFVVTHSGSTNGCSSVRAKMSVNLFNFSALEKYIACYFEVELLNVCAVGIGFSAREFPLQDEEGRQNWLGSWPNSVGFSIGFWSNAFVSIGGNFLSYDQIAPNKLFPQKKGDKIGCGLLHYPPKNLLNYPFNNLLQFFVTYNGKLLCMYGIQPHFFQLELFPTITLGFMKSSIRANFGKDDFCFDRSKLFNEEIYE